MNQGVLLRFRLQPRTSPCPMMECFLLLHYKHRQKHCLIGLLHLQRYPLSSFRACSVLEALHFLLLICSLLLVVYTLLHAMTLYFPMLLNLSVRTITNVRLHRDQSRYHLLCLLRLHYIYTTFHYMQEVSFCFYFDQLLNSWPQSFNRGY